MNLSERFSLVFALEFLEQMISEISAFQHDFQHSRHLHFHFRRIRYRETQIGQLFFDAALHGFAGHAAQSVTINGCQFSKPPQDHPFCFSIRHIVKYDCFIFFPIKFFERKCFFDDRFNQRIIMNIRIFAHGNCQGIGFRFFQIY